MRRLNFHFQNNTQVVDSDISRIEQAIVAVQCVIRHQYNMDTVKHKNGRVTFKGSLEINNIIVGRATAANKKGCKRQTYTNALERLLTNSIEDLMIPVPEEVEPEVKDVFHAQLCFFMLILAFSCSTFLFHAQHCFYK